jgi:hypothetical protein
LFGSAAWLADSVMAVDNALLFPNLVRPQTPVPRLTMDGVLLREVVSAVLRHPDVTRYAEQALGMGAAGSEAAAAAAAAAGPPLPALPARAKRVLGTAGATLALVIGSEAPCSVPGSGDSGAAAENTVQPLHLCRGHGAPEQQPLAVSFVRGRLAVREVGSLGGDAAPSLAASWDGAPAPSPAQLLRLVPPPLEVAQRLGASCTFHLPGPAGAAAAAAAAKEGNAEGGVPAENIFSLVGATRQQGAFWCLAAAAAAAAAGEGGVHQAVGDEGLLLHDDSSNDDAGRNGRDSRSVERTREQFFVVEHVSGGSSGSAAAAAAAAGAAAAGELGDRALLRSPDGRYVSLRQRALRPAMMAADEKELLQNMETHWLFLEVGGGRANKKRPLIDRAVFESAPVLEALPALARMCGWCTVRADEVASDRVLLGSVLASESAGWSAPLHCYLKFPARADAEAAMAELRARGDTLPLLRNADGDGDAPFNDGAVREAWPVRAELWDEGRNAPFNGGGGFELVLGAERAAAAPFSAWFVGAQSRHAASSDGFLVSNATALTGAAAAADARGRGIHSLGWRSLGTDRLPAVAFSASDHHADCPPHYACLHREMARGRTIVASGWRAARPLRRAEVERALDPAQRAMPRQWLQLDLGEVTEIAGVSTQGTLGGMRDNGSERPPVLTTGYTLCVSENGADWEVLSEPEQTGSGGGSGGSSRQVPIVFSANGGDSTGSLVATHALEAAAGAGGGGPGRPIAARYVRFCPVSCAQGGLEGADREARYGTWGDCRWEPGAAGERACAGMRVEVYSRHRHVFRGDGTAATPTPADAEAALAAAAAASRPPAEPARPSPSVQNAAAAALADEALAEVRATPAMPAGGNTPVYTPLVAMPLGAAEAVAADAATAVGGTGGDAEAAAVTVAGDAAMTEVRAEAALALAADAVEAAAEGSEARAEAELVVADLHAQRIERMLSAAASGALAASVVAAHEVRDEWAAAEARDEWAAGQTAAQTERRLAIVTAQTVRLLSALVAPRALGVPPQIFVSEVRDLACEGMRDIEAARRQHLFVRNQAATGGGGGDAVVEPSASDADGAGGAGGAVADDAGCAGGGSGGGSVMAVASADAATPPPPPPPPPRKLGAHRKHGWALRAVTLPTNHVRVSLLLDDADDAPAATKAAAVAAAAAMAAEAESSSGSCWGFALSATACGIPEAAQQRLLARHAADVRAATRASCAGWGARADEQLVAWANAAAEQLEVDHPTPLLRRGAAAPPGRWLAIDPRDVVLRKDDRMRLQLIASHSAPSRAFRFAVLKLLNRRLKRVLPLLDVGSTQRWRVGHKLRRMGHCIFLDLKRRLLDDALERTLGRQRRAHDLNLDHTAKLQSQDRGDTAPASSKCLFAQVFAQTRGIAPDTFRRSAADSRSQAFHVRFKNESGIDAGGVYREALTEIVDDLHCAEFSLFLLCPNGQHAYPTNANKYVPHPASTTALALEMLELVGKVMGLSLRQKATLPFQLPSIVWRALLGQPCNREDLRAVDTMCVQLLERIEAMATAAAFTDLTAELEGGLRFSAVGSDAKAVELKPVRANAPMQCCPPARLSACPPARLLSPPACLPAACARAVTNSMF